MSDATPSYSIPELRIGVSDILQYVQQYLFKIRRAAKELEKYRLGLIDEIIMAINEIADRRVPEEERLDAAIDWLDRVVTWVFNFRSGWKLSVYEPSLGVSGNLQAAAEDCQKITVLAELGITVSKKFSPQTRRYAEYSLASAKAVHASVGACLKECRDLDKVIVAIKKVVDAIVTDTLKALDGTKPPGSPDLATIRAALEQIKNNLNTLVMAADGTPLVMHVAAALPHLKSAIEAAN